MNEEVRLMRIRIAAFLALAGSLALPSGQTSLETVAPSPGQPTTDRQPTLAQSAREDWNCFTADIGPIMIVCQAIAAHADTAGVIAEIAGKLHVSRDSAAALAETQLRLRAMRESEPPRVDEPIAASLDRMLRRAIEREPAAHPLVLFLADVAIARGKDVAAEVLPVVRRIPDPVTAIVEAARGLSYSENREQGRLLLSAALRLYPDDPDLLEALGAQHGSAGAASGPGRITAGRAELRDSSRKLSADTLMTRVRRQIGDLTSAGLAAEARALFEALPAASQQSIVREKESDYGPDVRLQLAAAYLLTGNRDRAAELAKTARANAGKENAAYLKILDAALSSKGDFFDVIVAVSTSGMAGTISKLYADLLESHGYGAFAADMLRGRAEWIEGEAETWERHASADHQALLAILLADAQTTRARAELLAPEPKDNPALRRLLEQPRLSPFRELPLPEAIEGNATVIDCSDTEKIKRTTHLQPFVYPIRMERKDNDVVAIGISPTLDPVGELGLGGYWVLRSRNGGATWTSYYTGLRENFPYVVPPASKLPLLADDRLRIEVEVRELDLSSITFPPIALRTARSANGLYLDFAWSDLARDSDGDGLTDLLEERIVTDPHAADTDGDGITDGRDSLPQIAMQPGRSPRAEALAYVAGDYELGRGAIITGIVDTEEAKNACVRRRSLIGERTLFMIGDRADFAPLDLPHRAIVLTRGEHALYEKKFGPTYAATISNFVADPAGTRVLIGLYESWRGMTVLLTKAKRGWKTKVLSSWIT
jgi:hypothetical protein